MLIDEELNNEETTSEEVEVEVVESRAEASEARAEVEDPDKFVLITFILTAIAVALCTGWIVGSIAAIVLSAISLNRTRQPVEATKQPFITFKKITDIAALIVLIVAIVAAVAWTIGAIVKGVTDFVKAANEANNSVSA